MAIMLQPASCWRNTTSNGAARAAAANMVPRSDSAGPTESRSSCCASDPAPTSGKLRAGLERRMKHVGLALVLLSAASGNAQEVKVPAFTLPASNQLSAEAKIVLERMRTATAPLDIAG